jgi:uncharacterized protein YceH (UPF0502 family)
MSEDRLDEAPQPMWCPLNPTQRRVLGVLMEKAKTTPDAYPMTLKAIATGSNQKSNRDPQMDLDTDQVEEALESLREMKAVAEIQGDGRVSKYRHFAYDWFGVDKEEMAIMAELLLRGEQTVGELRGRAARMEPIGSLEELKPILARMVQRKLVVTLTPAGRGQTVTHGLYKDRELTDLDRRFGSGTHSIEEPTARSSESQAAPERTSPSAAQPLVAATDELRAELNELREEVERLRSEVEELKELLQ